MPIYEYRCRSCEGAFEELVRLSTKPEDVLCPKCGKKECERLLSVFSSSGSSGGGSYAPAPSRGGFS